MIGESARKITPVIGVCVMGVLVLLSIPFPIQAQTIPPPPTMTAGDAGNELPPAEIEVDLNVLREFQEARGRLGTAPAGSPAIETVQEKIPPPTPPRLPGRQDPENPQGIAATPPTLPGRSDGSPGPATPLSTASTQSDTVPPDIAKPLARILFGQQSDTLSPDAQRALSDFAGEHATTRTRFEAIGYGTPTDEEAGVSGRLALRRALAVRQFLADAGIPQNRILIRAMATTPSEGAQERVDLYAQASKASSPRQ